MSKIIFMGTGAAPGVPSLSKGWGNCNPDNPKNRRKRIGTYIEIGNQKLLIDTSPDLRMQLLENDIRYIDGVLYTHGHADHLHGIDDLRELNRIMEKPINIYGMPHTIDTIKERFSYLLTSALCKKDKCMFKASLIAHQLSAEESLYLGNVKIDVLRLEKHNVPSNGYIFNDGEIVYVADCQKIFDADLNKIQKRPEVLILPLTVFNPQYAPIFHMTLDKLLEYVNLIKPKKAIINHMASECDYDELNNVTPQNVLISYDNMVCEYNKG